MTIIKKDPVDDKVYEIMAITQEECAEVIQAISKIFRFGMGSSYKGITNKEHLEEEMGDLHCMLDLIETFANVDKKQIERAKIAKKQKLEQYSNIFT